MGFSHLSYLCEWLCVIFVCDYKKKYHFFWY